MVKKTWRYWVPAMIAMALFGIANLPMQRKAVITNGSIRSLEGQYKISETGIPVPVVAGWPETFYSRYPEETESPTTPAFETWSRPALLRDLGFGLVFAIGLGIIVGLLKRKSPQASADEIDESTDVPVDESGNENAGDPNVASRWQRMRGAKIRLSIADLILLTLFIAMPLGYFQWNRRLANRDLEIGKSLGPDASVVREWLVPSVVHRWLPKMIKTPSFQKAMTRTTKVQLQDPTDAQVRAALSLPYLRTIAIGGGKYDFAALS